MESWTVSGFGFLRDVKYLSEAQDEIDWRLRPCYYFSIVCRYSRLYGIALPGWRRKFWLTRLLSWQNPLGSRRPGSKDGFSQMFLTASLIHKSLP